MIGRRAMIITRMIMITVLVVSLAGCADHRSAGGNGSSPDASSGASPGASSGAAVTGKITVLAAASLTESFTRIGHDFEKAHPGTTVTFSFGSSATLATQVNEGAPADVFASADQRTMKSVTDAGNASGTPTIFATNTLEIAVPPGNPGKITGLADFADPDKKTALCAEQVPCGAAADKLFSDAGVTPKPVSYEQDVKAALQKVEQDEVDAALVYRTDVTAAGAKVQGIDVPQAGRVVNRYPITVVKASSNPDTARAFVGYVTSENGAAELRRAGFGRP